MHADESADTKGHGGGERAHEDLAQRPLHDAVTREPTDHAPHDPGRQYREEDRPEDRIAL